MIKLAITLVLMAYSLPVFGGDARAREEYKARPACVGIVDGATWAECMARFKDVRPKHKPTDLMFKDWRS